MSIVGQVGSNPVYWANSNPATLPQSLNLDGGTQGFAVGINNLGNIVGTISTGINTKPVYWANSNPATLPQSLNLDGGTQGFAAGINNLGNIVGQVGSNPVYWANSNPATLPEPLNLGVGTQGIAFGINNLGNIVGRVGINPVYWANSNPATLPQPLSLGVETEGFAYGINNLGNIVGRVGSNPVYWANSNPATLPQSLNLGGGVNGGFAYGINDGNILTSDICFPAGTPIKTDQGSVNIESLDTTIHTINGQPILFITQTVTLDKYLIGFRKNAIGRNIPSQATIMSKDHKVEYEGQMVPAYRFLNVSSEVKKVKYNGEILYNVLLADYGRMEVNNMVCETLHPENNILKHFHLVPQNKQSGLQQGAQPL